MSDPKKACSGVTDAYQHKKCMAAMQGCADNSLDQAACSDMANFCATNEEWPAQYTTDKGSYKLTGQGSCFLLFKILANKGEAPVEVAGMKLGGGSSLPAIDVSESKKEEASTPPPVGKPAPEPKKDVVHDPKSLEKCGKVDEANRDACYGMADWCAAESTWPQQLVTTGGIFTAKSETNCFLLSKVLAGKGYEVGTPTEAPKPPEGSASASDTGSATAATGDEPEKKKPDYLKSFSDANLSLSASGKEVEVSRKLHFAGGKGMEIRLKYTIKKLGGGRYAMDYAVFQGEKKVGGDQSITFGTTGGGINLGFAIDLWSEGNFGKVKSISIVEME